VCYRTESSAPIADYALDVFSALSSLTKRFSSISINALRIMIEPSSLLRLIRHGTKNTREAVEVVVTSAVLYAVYVSIAIHP